MINSICIALLIGFVFYTIVNQRFASYVKIITG